MYTFSINLLPESNNPNILKLISQIGIKETPSYIDIQPEIYSENGSCFENVKKKIERSGGRAILGWQFCEYSFMIEGEFHSIWESPEGKLIDLTPSNVPNTRQALFVIDKTRTYDGNAIDNIRLNTTDNKLVDDVIEIEEAKFKLQDHFYSADGVLKKDISEESKLYWHLIGQFSDSVDELLINNGSLQASCFCNSGLMFESCHRIGLKELICKISNLNWLQKQID